ncbi:MAG: hypothetical protein ACI956_001032 [Nonlabens sp.]|jgi:hypothetical protein
MNLFTVCKLCRTQTSIKSNASTRPDLIMDKGEEFNIQCSNCLKNSTIHVNDIRAKKNNTILIGGLIIGFVVTLLLWNILDAVSTVSLLIPAIIWKEQSDAVNTFNKYLIRR